MNLSEYVELRQNSIFLVRHFWPVPDVSRYTKVIACVLNIKYMIPTIMEAEIPNTSTGPATVNIFPPTPITYPSDLNSIAGETIELAKPVIGIKDPAPANFPILLNRFNPVKNAAIPINKMETIVPDAWVSKPRSLHILRIICPIVQINPPTQNALKQFFSIGELGVFLSTYSWYAF